MSIFQKAVSLKNELDSLRPLSQDDEQRIMQKFRLDWNYHSNNLEGNALTYGETKALLLFNITAQGKPLKDHLEISGHNEAIKWIEEVVKQERPLTENFIRELHQLILKERYEVEAKTPDGNRTRKWVEIGKYKSTQNHVETITGEIFRFASPEETPSKMTDLLDWYKNEIEKSDLEPILLASEFHYRFIRIHPFDDGNGRMARILMNFILMQFAYPPVVIKTEDKENYFAVLRLADAGNLIPFVEYITHNLTHSLEIMIQGARGESIEEEDDLDKEIALLKAEFENSVAEYEEIKSIKTIRNISHQCIKPILLKLIDNARPFVVFYLKNEISIRLKYSYEVKFMFDEVKSNIDRVFNVELEFLDKEISSFDVEISHMVLNKLGFEEFNYFVYFKIEFFKTKYVFSFKNDLTIEKKYHEIISFNEIEDVLKEDKRRHKELLQKNLKN